MWIEVFKTGRHTDSEGREQDYTKETLDELISKYNRKVNEDKSYEAPVVKGHPQTNDPAYGWVKKLTRQGETLLADIKEMENEFAEEIKKGMYRKISIALYPDNMLRHIGFLGAASPAVKGLKSVKFTDDKAIYIENELSENLIENYAHDKTENSQKSNFTEKKPNYSEYEENILLKQELNSYKSKLEELELSIRNKDFREFALGLVNHQTGCLIAPAQIDDVVTILEMAYNIDKKEKNLNYSELSEGFQHLNTVKNFFLKLKPILQLGDTTFSKANQATNYDNDFENRNVNPERMELHRRAKNIQSENPQYSYEQALSLAR